MLLNKKKDSKRELFYNSYIENPWDYNSLEQINHFKCIKTKQSFAAAGGR